MTKNMKDFLEAASGDGELIERLIKAETPETVIKLAEEKGFSLTEDDVKIGEAPTGELSDDELDAVAGGTGCGCVLGGGGGDGCVCVFGGCSDSPSGGGSFPDKCFCFLIGGGSD
ncbi:MAG: Nif11-like leader peptide family RiPP precursor [Oscillospiraceae bacterium]|jgi:predicted ribosomally synthesized peptide with nif11-like leader|nr:Nif11-like leader peptide family RiPP precursor [Oscillospiraceae bacterium]